MAINLSDDKQNKSSTSIIMKPAIRYHSYILASFNPDSMRFLCTTFFFLSCFFAGTFSFGQAIIKASDFGVKSNSFENGAPGIRKAIEACKAKGNAILLLP